MPTPPNLTQKEQKVWFETWLRSDAAHAYREWQKDRGMLAVAIDAEGGITIQDVKPGTYGLSIQPIDPAAKQWRALGVAAARITVPEIAEGDLGKPLDIGTIELKLAK